MRNFKRHNFEDLTGDRFTYLKVIRFTNKKWGGIRLWECLCKCGKTVHTTTTKIRSGHTKSCGCYSKDRATTHNMSATRFNQTFRSIKQRCTNPNISKYHLYGGKGIKCLWKSFEEFRDDMYESYLGHVEKFGEIDTTIERIDGNKNYSKENCRWATRLEQARNTKNVIFLTFNGKKLCLGEWSKELNIRKKTLYNRIYKGWSVERAITTPVKN